MLILRWFKIRKLERGLLFRDGTFSRVLRPGWRFVLDPLYKVRVRRVSVREPWLADADLDVIVRSGALEGEAEILDLEERQRAVVWVDGRVEAVLGPGLYALWTVFRAVRVELFDAREARFESPELAAVLAARGAAENLERVSVPAGMTGLVYRDERPIATVGPGAYAYWKGEGRITTHLVERREQVLDVSGQEIMTADKVTLRLNTLVTFRVTDPEKAVTVVEDPTQALYRQAQLVVREVVGARQLDALLSDKEGVQRELLRGLRPRAKGFGVEVRSLGIRDVILPGEMKEILNRVMEAKKAAEAALVTRREETAAMRSQANTARIFESSPTLMRLRELEVLEKVAEKAELKVLLAEGGLKDQVIKLV